jgi:two-component system, NarL family, sensor kinase
MPTQASELIFFFIVVFLLTLSLAGFIIVLLLKDQQKNINYQNNIDKIKSEQEQIILKSQIEAQEIILKNISREIHDNIGLTLSLSKLHLNNVNNPCNNVIVSTELITKAISNLRVLSRTLNSEYVLSSGFLQSLKKELGYMSNIGKQVIQLEVRGNQKFLEASRELMLFRITLEIYNNAIKHSEAKTIFTSIIYNDNDLKITIQDDGKGFHYKPEESTYLGLKNIQSRVELLKGTCEINSKQNVGTIISLSIPFNC